MENYNKLFSVIMPAYNAEMYIESAIDSVIRQTYQNWELIIVDDCSTDNTVQIIERKCKNEKRIKLIKAEHQGTAGAVRNIALEYVNGEYIQILDSDDYLSEDLLSNYTDILSKHPDADIILPVALMVNDNQEILHRWDNITGNEYINGKYAFELSIDWEIHGWNCLKAELLKRIRYESEIINGDELTTRKLLFSADKVCFSQGFYYYRENLNSTTRSNSSFIKMFDTQKTSYLLYEYSIQNNMPYHIQKKCAKQFLNLLFGKLYIAVEKENDLNKKQNDYISSVLENCFRKIEIKMLSLSKASLFYLFSFGNYHLCRFNMKAYLKLKSFIKSLFPNKVLKKISAIEKAERESIKQLYKNIDTDNYSGKKKVIVMFDGRTIAGGLCDRLRGALSIYQTCKKMNIEYRLYFVSPFLLQNYLEPNSYNWLTEQSDIKYNNYSLPIFLYSERGDKKEADVQERYVENLLKQDYNQFHFYTNAHYSLFSENYSNDFSELFKPSILVQQQLHKYLDGKTNYISVSFRFMQLLGDFEEKYKSFYEVLSVSEKDNYLQKSLKVLRSIYNKEQRLIFVATDSKTLLNEVTKLSFCFTIPGDIAHIDVAKNDNSNKWEKTFIDFYMIANAQKVYLAHTGKMHYSGFPKNAALLSGKPFKIIEY